MIEPRDLLATGESIHTETAQVESSRIGEAAQLEGTHAEAATSSAQAEPVNPVENCAAPAPAGESAVGYQTSGLGQSGEELVDLARMLG
jgi:hypothetical protein